MLLRLRTRRPRPRRWQRDLAARWRNGPLDFIKLRLDEVRTAMGPLNDEYPPVLTLKQAAKLIHLAPGTLKRKVSEGHFRDSVRRGRPLRFWRDRFLKEFFAEK